MMNRRGFLAATAAGVATALARPAIAGEAKTIVFVPAANLTSLDPVWTSAAITRNHALLVYETLYGRDEKLEPQFQMLEGHRIEDDGRRWTMRLRDGLLFHDGTPVLARDCVASLQRWMKRDPIGATIIARLDSLEATDDRTLVWRLKKPFPGLPAALAKTQPSPVIMPARLAATDPFKQVTEVVGSGPFRFLPNEYVPGSHVAYAKFDRYTPRAEPPSHCAGGYVAKVDRVEWRIIPDAGTAANALIAGEVDWIEMPLPDLLPLLRKSSGVTVGQLDPYGTLGGLRPNQLNAPTSNVGVRRAIMAAIDQTEVMTAVMGDDPSGFHAPVGFFMPGTPSATDAGMETVRRKHTPDEVRAMLKEAGYAGEKVVLMHPTDQTFYDAMTQVVASSLKAVGMNIDDQAMDWGTVVQRRASKAPLDKGGWSLFVSGFPVAEYRDPLMATAMRGNGAKAWFGWAEDPKIEELRESWLDATDPAERHKLDAALQVQAFESVPFVPLGQYMQSAAWRSNLSGLLKGPAPLFWNVTKT
jgi:peptide/nickel transport system substrate-binding protein